MKILCYGNTTNPAVLLIHGFQSPYQVWNPFIQELQEKYYVIVPVLAGHDVQNNEDCFVSFTEQAKCIEEYCKTNRINQIEIAYGMSMGGVLLANLWERNKIHISKIVFDGSPLCGMPLISFFKWWYKNITHEAQKRNQKVIKQAEGTIICKELMPEFLELLDHIADATIEQYLEAIGKYRLPVSLSTNENMVYYFHGTASNETLAKKSAKFMKKLYPKAEIICMKGKAHCEYALLEPSKMIDLLKQYEII
jgi:esterase/lipase